MAAHFALVKKLFGLQTAAFSSLLLIFPPVMFCELGVRALGHANTLFFGAFSVFLWFKVFAEKKRACVFPLGLSLGAGLWLNPVFILYLPALFLMTLFWRRGFGRFFRRRRVNPWLKVLLGAINAIILAYLVKQLLVFCAGPMAFKFLGFDFSRPPFQWKGLKKIFLLAGTGGLLLGLARGRKTVLLFLKRWWPLAAGFAAGYLPAVIFKLAGGDGYRILHTKGMVDAAHLPAKLKTFAVDLIAGSTWGARLGAGPVPGFERFLGAGIVLFFIGAFVVYFYEHRQTWKSLAQQGVRQNGFFFCLLTVTFLPLTLLSTLEADRYMAPFYWTSSVAAGFFLSRIADRSRAPARIAAVLGVAGLVFYYSWAAGRYAANYPSRQEDIRGLVRVLEQENLAGGMTDYDRAYQLSFYSGERLAFVPFKGAMRVPDYKTRVDALERKALVFKAGSAEEKEFWAAHPGFIPGKTVEFKHYRIFVAGPENLSY
jgi:hypothetical protein